MIGSLNIFLSTSICLFALGIFGVLIRRNALLVLMSIELMLNAVNMAFITFARSFGSGVGGGEGLGLVQAMQGHIFVLMIMAVAAAEAAIGIAIVVTIYRSRGKVLVDEARELKG
jgi:NADH-quinone oxidoreductase subunit K